MAEYKIDAVRPDGFDEDRRIDALRIAGGGVYQIDTFIDWIRSGVHRFWTTAHGRSVWVVALQHPRSGRWYLTTEGDGFPPNNLLNLPRC